MEQNLLEDIEPKSTFDVKRFMGKIAKNYVWFIIAITFFMAAAYFYLQYTTTLYQVSAFVEVQPTNEAANLLVGSPFAPSANSIQKSMPDMNGEIFKFQSAALIGEVVDSLRLDIEVTEKKGGKNQLVDIDYLPFSISVEKDDPDKESQLYKLTLDESSFELKSRKEDFKGYYDQPLVVEGDTVIIQLKDLSALKKKNTWDIVFSGRQNAISTYISRLIVSPVSKGGVGMLQVNMKDEIPERGKKIIGALISKYDLANFIFKNKALRSEIAFLNKRLDTVNADLETQENYVRNFKANNKINDVSSTATQVLGSLTGIDTKKSDNEYKEQLLKLIESNINPYSNREERINVPGLQDGELQGLVGKYNDLVVQKNEILEKGTSMDLRLTPLNSSLADTKRNIMKRVTGIRQELITNNGFLQSQERSMTSRFVTLPGKEKDYIEVNRLLSVKQSLYIFLLQRKEDKNVEFASSNIQGTRILDWRASNIQDPKPIMVYAIGLILALLIPAAIILVSFLLNTRIESSNQIYKATSLPIAGEIAYVRRIKDEIVITTDNVSPVAEQFRTLRTNISYLNADLSKKVLLVTSAISGEGKSFISLNIASALAISNKKVVLLEFDLRDPSLYDKVHPEKTEGISNFLAGELTADQIVQPVTRCENLYYINSGSYLPANPGEIIHSTKMKHLFDYLRENFDYIIMDTPPIEAVSDALTLGKWADTSFFVIRHKYSFRSSLVRINQLNEDKKIPHPALIINGIRTGDGFNKVHGYGYGYTDKLSRKKNKARSNLKIA